MISRILFFPTAIALAILHAEPVSALGVFGTQHVDESFVLKSSKPLIDSNMGVDLIRNYISEVNPDREVKAPNDIKTADLAQRIFGAAVCFEIDPFVLTALIRQETGNFYQRATSPTGAVGFGQFTTVAMQEIWDQLGHRGTRYARQEAIQYFQGVMRGDCLPEYGGFQNFGSKYVNYWDYKKVANWMATNSKITRTAVKELANQPEIAVVYAAMLLKIDLALVKNGLRTQCISKRNGALGLTASYSEAAMLYNGEHCERQIMYQNNVLNIYYKEITSVAARGE